MSKLRIFGIFGDHPRHLYYANAIQRAYGLCGALIQDRGTLIPPAPATLDLPDLANWQRHFEAREQMEFEAFGVQPQPDAPYLFVSRHSLNTPTSAEFMHECQPDLVLIFGVGMITPPVMGGIFDPPMINMHLGLSPRYRGAATLFWPFYFLEPNHAGVTFHQIVTEPDAGAILHQCRPGLHYGDGIHRVATNAVLKAVDDMLDLIPLFPYWTYHRQRNTGKCFLASDFQAEHLRMIYDVYDNKIVDAYLDGRIAPKEPYLYADNLTPTRDRPDAGVPPMRGGAHPLAPLPGVSR